MDLFSPDLATLTQHDGLADFFDAPFTFDDSAWSFPSPSGGEEAEVEHLTGPARADADLYQTFVTDPPLPLPSEAGFAGPSNAFTAHYGHTVAQSVQRPVQEVDEHAPNSPRLDDVEEIPATTAAHKADGKRAYSRDPDWDKHQSILRKLYLDEDKTLDEVKEMMEREHGFSPTSRQYKNRFALWGWQKKLPGTVAVWMSTKRQKRKREDGKETTFSYRGIEWKIPKIEASAARASKQASGSNNRTNTPVGVAYWTPRLTDRSLAGTENARPSIIPALPVQPGMSRSPLTIDRPTYDAGALQNRAQGRQLLLTWNGRPKSELDTTYRAAQAAHGRREHQLAQDLYAQALEGYRQVLGATAEETIAVLHSSVSLYLEQDSETEAYKLLEDSVQAHVTLWGEDADQTIHYALDVANLLSGCNREDDAIAFLRSAHSLIRRPRASGDAPRESSPERASLPGIGELLAAAGAATRYSDLSSLNFGLSVARNANKAGEPAAEALLIAIIDHCEYDPGRLAGQRLHAIAEIIDLYRTRGFSYTSGDYIGIIQKAESAFNATVRNRAWNPDDEGDFDILKACLRVAKSMLDVNEYARANKMFHKITEMTERVFGLGEHAITMLIEIGRFHQERNGWSSSRPWFEHALANAIQELPEKDGVRAALEMAKDKRHFCYSDSSGRPFKTIFGVSGVTIRPPRLYLGA